MRPIRLIQCGVGGFGAGWLNVVKSNPDVQCVALVDPNADNMAKAVDRLAFDTSKTFTTLEAALGSVDADAILTVTPPAVHHQHAHLAFNSGLHLLTEKPIADSLANGADMVRLAKKAGKQLMVSQNYRYNPGPRFMRSMVTGNALGTLLHGDITFGINADFRGSFRETMEYPLLVDMSIHHFDLMRYVLGANARSIYIRSIKTPAPQYQHEAAFKGIIEFTNGVVLNYSGDWGSPRLPTSWSGDWALQFASGLLCWNEREIYSEHSEPWSKDRHKKFYAAPAMPVAGQAYSLAEFVRAIREDRPAETSGADNLHSFALVEAALQSIRRCAPVALAEVTPQV